MYPTLAVVLVKTIVTVLNVIISGASDKLYGNYYCGFSVTLSLLKITRTNDYVSEIVTVLVLRCRVVFYAVTHTRSFSN